MDGFTFKPANILFMSPKTQSVMKTCGFYFHLFHTVEIKTRKIWSDGQISSIASLLNLHTHTVSPGNSAYYTNFGNKE